MQARIAGPGLGEERTGLWIALAEEAKFVRVFARQDADIALDIPAREARRMAAMLSGANCAAYFAGAVHPSDDSG